MKVTIVHTNSGINKEEYPMYDTFIKYLQKTYPLKNDITINFLGERKGGMTTGSRKTHSLKILSKNRMNRDIMRTLAHEWVHEYQMEVQHKTPGPDIGGKIENEANSESGKMMKKFEKHFPKYEDKVYE